MKRAWTVQRSWLEQTNGQRRWDHAYQCLLRWAQETGASRPSLLPSQEVSDESSTVHPGSDDPSTTDADD